MHCLLFSEAFNTQQSCCVAYLWITLMYSMLLVSKAMVISFTSKAKFWKGRTTLSIMNSARKTNFFLNTIQVILFIQKLEKNHSVHDDFSKKVHLDEFIISLIWSMNLQGTRFNICLSWKQKCLQEMSLKKIAEMILSRMQTNWK